jgi:hypothetical protein
MNHPQWIQWINQILFTFLSIQNRIVYLKTAENEVVLWGITLVIFKYEMQKNCWETGLSWLWSSWNTNATQLRMLSFEPKQFRHTNPVWACTTFSEFVTVTSLSAYLLWMFLFSILLLLRRLPDNPAPAQFPTVHFHELFSSVVFIFCVPQALKISRNI